MSPVKNILALLVLAVAALVSGCGDSRIVAVEGTGQVQGVWEGIMTLSANTDSIEQTSRIRLELVQQEYSFDGFLIRIDPLASGFGKAPADTFVVSNGTISGTYVSFHTDEPGAGSALFEGTLTDRTLEGSIQGNGFYGSWQAGLKY